MRLQNTFDRGMLSKHVTVNQMHGASDTNVESN